jgi:hypothetical protein
MMWRTSQVRANQHRAEAVGKVETTGAGAASEGRRGGNAETGRPARGQKQWNETHAGHSRDRFQRENSPLYPGFQRGKITIFPLQLGSDALLWVRTAPAL